MFLSFAQHNTWANYLNTVDAGNSTYRDVEIIAAAHLIPCDVLLSPTVNVANEFIVWETQSLVRGWVLTNNCIIQRLLSLGQDIVSRDSGHPMELAINFYYDDWPREIFYIRGAASNRCLPRSKSGVRPLFPRQPHR